MKRILLSLVLCFSISPVFAYCTNPGNFDDVYRDLIVGTWETTETFEYNGNIYGGVYYFSPDGQMSLRVANIDFPADVLDVVRGRWNICGHVLTERVTASKYVPAGSESHEYINSFSDEYGSMVLELEDLEEHQIETLYKVS